MMRKPLNPWKLFSKTPSLEKVGVVSDNGAQKEAIPEEVEISLPVAPIIKKRGRPHKWK